MATSRADFAASVAWCVPAGFDWVIGFRDIARSVDVRTIFAAIVPASACGNTLPLLLPSDLTYKQVAPFIVANLNSLLFDFVARSKIQSTHVNWYLAEQLPVVPIKQYNVKKFGKKYVSQIVREAVLELTYTAHDMAPFARDMGYVDGKGKVKPPFKWDETRRLHLRAKLDAIYFHLYGITNRDDVRYIYSTFPIVKREETAAYGRYLSCDLCLAWISALAAGDPDAAIKV